jgi:radical SAM protein with 4Fe4S-binding SPASM domain
MTTVNIDRPYDERGRPRPSLRESLTRVIGRRLTLGIFRRGIGWLSRYYGRRGLFECIEIETINRCNNTCSFCPVNVDADPRKLARMDETVFRKIIDELAELGYSDRIAFHSNNEPFLDKQLTARIAYARQRCPRAFLFFYTNGTALNLKRLVDTIDSGIDRIMINNYNDDLVLNENISRIVEEMNKPEYSRYRSHFKIILRMKTAVLSNRGGSAPNKVVDQDREYLQYGDLGCTRPFRQLVVRPTGEISLCCNDPLGKATLGDVRKQTLREIWSGPVYRALREELLREGRKNLDICNVCDVADMSLRHSLSVMQKDRRERTAKSAPERRAWPEAMAQED